MNMKIAIGHKSTYPTGRRGETRNDRGKSGTEGDVSSRHPIRDPTRPVDPDSHPLRISHDESSANRESSHPKREESAFPRPQDAGDECLITLIPVLHTLNDSYYLI
jgi:hypothetical protein